MLAFVPPFSGRSIYVKIHEIHEIHESGELSHVATTCNDVSNQCKPEVLELLLKLKGNGILVITVSRSTSVHMHSFAVQKRDSEVYEPN